jgi:hypothetical protein
MLYPWDKTMIESEKLEVVKYLIELRVIHELEWAGDDYTEVLLPWGIHELR